LNLSAHPSDLLHRLKTGIDRNRALAKDLGITGMPGFIVGTELVPGALDLSGLKDLIARARNGKWGIFFREETLQADHTSVDERRTGMNAIMYRRSSEGSRTMHAYRVTFQQPVFGLVAMLGWGLVGMVPFAQALDTPEPLTTVQEEQGKGGAEDGARNLHWDDIRRETLPWQESTKEWV
jgi:hypothetical protein